MKRAILVALITIGCLVWTVSSHAQAQAPKQLCLQIGMLDTKILMVIKPFGSPVSLSSGKVKFYAIHGEATDNDNFAPPLSGTGHMLGDIFHFSLVGSTVASSHHNSFQFEGTWNTASETGSISWTYVVGAGSAISGGDIVGVPLSTADCRTLSLPR